MGKLGIPGLSFSWRRAVGLSAANGRLSRPLGIPLTRYGRQRKMGAALGCTVVAGIPIILIALLACTAPMLVRWFVR
jgi:hypothetical protein